MQPHVILRPVSSELVSRTLRRATYHPRQNILRSQVQSEGETKKQEQTHGEQSKALNCQYSKGIWLFSNTKQHDFSIVYGKMYIYI